MNKFILLAAGVGLPQFAVEVPILRELIGRQPYYQQGLYTNPPPITELRACTCNCACGKGFTPNASAAGDFLLSNGVNFYPSNAPTLTINFEGLAANLRTNLNTNFINNLITNGVVCAVRGHLWRAYGYFKLEGQAATRTCNLCGITQVETTTWKDQ